MRKLVPFAALIGIAWGCGGNGHNPEAISIPTKSLTVVAGGDTAGTADGPIATATFENPVNVAVADDGTVYVVDYDANSVRTIRNGVVSTLVSQADFQRPFGITVTSQGALYVETDANDSGDRDATTGTVWRVNTTTGEATVIARNLGRPRGLATTSDGTIVMSNLTRHIIQTLNPVTGAVATIAGQDGIAGAEDGIGGAATFDRPYGLTRDVDGSFLVADQNNNCIRRVTLTGEVTRFAGVGVAGSADGPITACSFNGPQDIKRVGARYFVADTIGHHIREIRNGYVSKFAGNGTPGFVDSTGSMASFFGLEGLCPTPEGNWLLVADGTGGEDAPYHRVRLFAL